MYAVVHMDSKVGADDVLNCYQDKAAAMKHIEYIARGLAAFRTGELTVDMEAGRVELHYPAVGRSYTYRIEQQ